MSRAGRHIRRPLVLACVMLAMFMAAVEVTIVATAMPAIVADLGGFSLYTWVFAALLLTQTATTVVFGKLADTHGRRPVLIGGICVFLLGSTLCGFAWSMPSLIAFRLLQGLGAGSIQPVATTIVGDLYTGEERASVQGYISSVWGFSAVVGPLAGALIVGTLSWHWIFWINIPIGFATIAGLLAFFHERVDEHRHSIDYPGAALFTLAIGALVAGLTQWGAHGSGSDRLVVATAAVFMIAVPLFLWRQRRAAEPMMMLDVWIDPLIGSANVATLLAGMALMGITSFLPIYVQGVMGKSALVAGLALTMMAVGWPLASALSRRFYHWIGTRGAVRLGGVLLAAGSFALVLLTPDASPLLAAAGSLVMGFGMGLLSTTCIIVIQGRVAWRKRGVATSSNVFARFLGSTLGVAVLGGVLNYTLAQHGAGSEAGHIRELIEGAAQDAAALPAASLVRQALADGLHATFLGIAALALLTLAMAVFVPAPPLGRSDSERH